MAPLQLVLVHAALVAVRGGAPGDCPGEAQIADALRARLPGTVVPAAAADAPDVLTIEVRGVSADTLRLVVSDWDGRERLVRFLPTSGTKRDCLALADSVAIIVERYLAEVVAPEAEARASGGATAPAPPAASSPAPGTGAWATVGAAVRAPDEGALPARAAVAFGVVSAASRVAPFGAARVGFAVGSHTRDGGALGPDGQGELKVGRWFGELVGGAAWGWAGGRLELAAVGGADALAIDAPRREGSRTQLEPYAGAEVAYARVLGRRPFWRVALGGEALLVRHRVEGLEGGMLYASPRGRLRLALELGFGFF